jgi:hypothetical protein
MLSVLKLSVIILRVVLWIVVTQSFVGLLQGSLLQKLFCCNFLCKKLEKLVILFAFRQFLNI